MRAFISVMRHAVSCGAYAVMLLGPVLPAYSSESSGAGQLIAPNQNDVMLEGRLAAIRSGDADTSARALVELIPDGHSVLRHHVALVQLAEASEGKMSLDILREACPQYHAWHARAVIIDPSRRVTILQWMAEKLWEMPSGREKEAAARTVIADVDRWLDAGWIAPKPGLDLACNAIMTIEAIGPGVSAAPVVELFKKHASANDKDLRTYIYDALWEIGRLPGDINREDIYEFLKNHYPDKHFPPKPDDFFFPIGLTTPQHMSWREYERLPALSFEQMRVDMKRCDCGDPHAGDYCRSLARSLIDRYDTKPDEVKAFVASLSEEELLYPGLLLGIMWSKMADPAYVSQKSGIHDAVLGSFEKKLANGPVSGKREVGIVKGADGYLRALATIPDDKRVPYTMELEKRLIRILLKAGPIWERLREEEPTKYYGKSPFSVLNELRARLSPEALECLAQSAQELLDNNTAGSGLSQHAAEDMENALKTLAASH